MLSVQQVISLFECVCRQFFSLFWECSEGLDAFIFFFKLLLLLLLLLLLSLSNVCQIIPISISTSFSIVYIIIYKTACMAITYSRVLVLHESKLRYCIRHNRGERKGRCNMLARMVLPRFLSFPG